MAPGSVHSLGCSSFGVSVSRVSPASSSSAAGKSPFPSLSAPVATNPGLGALSHRCDPCPGGVAEARVEKQQLQQRALFVEMKPCVRPCRCLGLHAPLPCLEMNSRANQANETVQ